MKIVVTYETPDIARLIKQDLARQGIAAVDADIKYGKGSATVSVEVSADEPPPASVEEIVGATQHATATAPPLRQDPAPSPTLTPIEGGNQPVDMSDILGASRHLESTTQGKFPPRERKLMAGESYDPPGDPQ